MLYLFCLFLNANEADFFLLSLGTKIVLVSVSHLNGKKLLPSLNKKKVGLDVSSNERYDALSSNLKLLSLAFNLSNSYSMFLSLI